MQSYIYDDDAAAPSLDLRGGNAVPNNRCLTTRSNAGSTCLVANSLLYEDYGLLDIRLVQLMARERLRCFDSRREDDLYGRSYYSS